MIKKSKKKSTKGCVKLREKILTDGTRSLYLDIYIDGKRSYEFLKLYIVPPKTGYDRQANKEAYQLAESIKAKRQSEIQSGRFGLVSDFKLNTPFLNYFSYLAGKREKSRGNYGNWQSTLKHLLRYCPSGTTLRNVDTPFVEGFKEYLQYEARTKSNTPLSQNSQSSYFNKLKATLNQAFEDRIISYNPAKKVEGIRPDETRREYLTIDELKKLAKTECRYEILKRAFLFSCITGMRWSDIQKLTWSELQRYGDGWRITFRQQKTRGLEYLDISTQARSYLGDQGKGGERVFTGLKYSAWHNLELQKWVMKAGINKDITFHCGRHTFAIIQLNMGTDIYTVSKLLGHKELKTTQVYAKIVDEKKREAVNRIPDINIKNGKQDY